MKTVLALASSLFSVVVIACGASDPSGQGAADLSSNDPGASISADCTPDECGPQPEIAVDKCPGGGYAGPVCERVDGKCGWHLTHCPGTTVSDISTKVRCANEPSTPPPHGGCKWDPEACEWLCI